MGIRFVNKNLVSIEAFTLYEMLELVQDAVLRGFRVSPENDHYPSSAMGVFTVKMVASEDEGVEVNNTMQDIVDKVNKEKEDVENNPEPVKKSTRKTTGRGRPKATGKQ